MKNLTFGFAFCIATLVAGKHVQAASMQILYVNGIYNTTADADESRKELGLALQNSTNRSGDAKFTFVVDGIYNPIGFAGSTAGGCELCEDKKELFIQKAAEEHYAKEFKKLLAPHNQVANLDKDAAIGVKRYFDRILPGTNSLEDLGLVSEENFALTTATTLAEILGYLRSPQKKVFVAHSQGNLLVNLAWAAYVAEVGQAARANVAFVNVANTSQFAISGLDITHGRDAALFSSATDTLDIDFSLETLPSKEEWTRTTPFCLAAACDFTLAGPTFEGVDGTGGLLDHAFVKTYLSSNDLPLLNDHLGIPITQGVQFTPGKTTFRDRLEDLIYAAAGSLGIVGEPFIGYSVTSLGYSVSIGGINDRGDLTGQCSDATGTYACVLYSGSSMWQRVSSGWGVAADINQSRQIVGSYSLDQLPGERAFIFSGAFDGPLVDLSTAIGHTGSSAASISDSGVIVGTTMRSDGTELRGFLLDGAVARDLGPLPGHSSSAAIKVSSNYAVGYSYSVSPRTSGTAFRFSLIDKTIEPVDKGGICSDQSIAWSVNDAGMTVGNCRRGPIPAPYFGFVYYREPVSGSESFEVFGDGISQTIINDVNNSGQFVGSNGSGAFIGRGSTLINLNERVPQVLGRYLLNAQLVNNQGVIVAIGTRSNVLAGEWPYEWLLLTPNR